MSHVCSKVTLRQVSFGNDRPKGISHDCENRIGPGSTSTETCRCCNRPGAYDDVLFQWCVGRRKRHQLLDPGLFGSLAATPQQPGWSWANIYYHTSVSAGADVARAREFTLNRVPGNVTLNANLNLSISATGNLGFVLPSYVFATPVLGGQASVSLLAAYGVVGTSWRGLCPVWLRAR